MKIKPEDESDESDDSSEEADTDEDDDSDSDEEAEVLKKRFCKNCFKNYNNYIKIATFSSKNHKLSRKIGPQKRWRSKGSERRSSKEKFI